MCAVFDKGIGKVQVAKRCECNGGSVCGASLAGQRREGGSTGRRAIREEAGRNADYPHENGLIIFRCPPDCPLEAFFRVKTKTDHQPKTASDLQVLVVPPARFERTTPALGERCSVP